MHLVSFRYLTFFATAAIFILSLFFYDHYWLPVLAGALTLLGILVVFLLVSWCSVRMLQAMLPHGAHIAARNV